MEKRKKNCEEKENQSGEESGAEEEETLSW